MKKMKWFSVVFVIVILAAVSAGAGTSRADFLLNHDIQFSVRFDDDKTVQAQENLVANGVTEPFTFPGSNIVSLNITVTDNQITISYPGSALFATEPFNGYAFTDYLNEFPAFGSVSIDSTTTVSGLTSSRVFFDADNVFINVSGLSETTGQIIRLDVGPAAAAAPVPSSLVLFGIGCAVLATGCWYQRRRVTPIACV